MTEKEYNNLQIGDKVRLTLVDLFGNKSYINATVSRISRLNEDEADNFGFNFKNVYAKAWFEGEELEFYVHEDRSELIQN